jgi:hypothetical protein
MAGLYEVEVEPEVRSWLENLADRDFGRVDFLVGLLAGHAADLGEPYTRHLGGKVRELRFHLLAQHAPRHLLARSSRRLILLTVFRKTRNAETAEVPVPYKPRRSAKPSTARPTTLSTVR